MNNLKNFINTLKKAVSRPFGWFKKTRRRNKIITIVVLVIALFFLTAPIRESAPEYTTIPVTVGTVSDLVSESGNVTSSGRFDVYPTSTGYIEEVYVQNGDTVESGANLFKVKSTATQQEKASAYVDYTNALATLNAAKSKMNSLQSALFKANQAFLNDKGVSNPSDAQKVDPKYVQQKADWLQAESDYNNQAAVIGAAQAGLNKAAIAYQATQDSITVAPAAGTIANFSAALGEKVTAATSTSPTLVVLSGISTPTIKIAFNEVDVNKLKIGQKATITFDAFRDKKYAGTVKTIDTAGTNTNGVITYNVTVGITNPDPNIKTEMTATVSIETAKHTNVLTVPNSAIKPYKGGKAVIVQGADRENQVKNKAGKVVPFHYVPVKVGLKGITTTEITSGVQEGTKVVTSSIQ